MIMNRLLPLFCITAFLATSAVAVYATRQSTNLGQALPSATAAFETSLQSAITSSATSMTLTANAIRGGGALSGYNCFTIDEGSAQAETVCGTVSGTAVSSLSRGISQSTGTTTVAALQFAHRRGANVKITDFPLVQIMKAQLNGEDTIPNLMTYANTVLIGVGSPTTTLATKYYVDNVAVAGASNADDTTKGIVEMATAAEAGAGTSAGATLARLALGANLATSTPTAACSAFCVVMATAGKIAQGFLDLTTSYTWTGLHTFSRASSTRASVFDTLWIGGSATSTLQGSTSGTSTLQGFLNIAGTNSTSTFSGHASTTNFQISGVCLGCPMAYTASSTAWSVSSGAVTYTGSIPANANTALGTWAVATDFGSGTVVLARAGLTSVVVKVLRESDADDCEYTFTWSGNDFSVTESDDGTSDCTASGTIYWYK